MQAAPNNSTSSDAAVIETAQRLFAKEWSVYGEQATEADQRWLSRFTANNFGVSDELLNDVGSGVFPLGALLNHSCVGNATHLYAFSPVHGPVQLWRTRRAVAKGEELTHSYLDEAMAIDDRYLLFICCLVLFLLLKKNNR